MATSLAAAATSGSDAGAAMPDGVSADQQIMLNRLASLSGLDFDRRQPRAFVSHAHSDHICRPALRVLEQESRDRVDAGAGPRRTRPRHPVEAPDVS